MHENSQRKATAELRRLQTEAEWRVKAIASTRQTENDELPQIEILTDTQTVYRNISRVMEVTAAQEKAHNSRELRAYLDPSFTARQARNGC
jgi:16S rRNA U1498 N3-methylase RsmE